MSIDVDVREADDPEFHRHHLMAAGFLRAMGRASHVATSWHGDPSKGPRSQAIDAIDSEGWTIARIAAARVAGLRSVLATRDVVLGRFTVVRRGG